MDDNLVKDRFGDWIGEGWRMFVDQWKPWIINMLVFAGIMAIPLGVFFVVIYAVALGSAFAVDARSDAQPVMLFGIFAVELVGIPVLVLVSTYFVAGLYKSAFKQLRGGAIQLSDVFSGGDRFLPLLGGTFLVGLLTMVGVMACIVPGILCAGLFYFTPHLIIDGGLGPVEAMKRSYEMNRPHLWWFTLFAIVVGFIAQAGSYVCYVGLLATYPLHFTIGAIAYRDCFGLVGVGSFPAKGAQQPDIYTPGSVVPPAGPAVCQYCHAPLSPAAVFCPGCGQNVT